MHGKFGLLSPGKAGSDSTALPSFFCFYIELGRDKQFLLNSDMSLDRRCPQSETSKNRLVIHSMSMFLELERGPSFLLCDYYAFLFDKIACKGGYIIRWNCVKCTAESERVHKLCSACHPDGTATTDSKLHQSQSSRETVRVHATTIGRLMHTRTVQHPVRVWTTGTRHWSINQISQQFIPKCGKNV